MLLRLILALALLVVAGPCYAQRGGGASAPDPFLLNQFSGQEGWQDIKLRSRRSAVINTSIRNLVLFNVGQSNSTNVLPTSAIPTNASAVDNFNVYDGAMYDVVAGPLLGTQGYTSGLGTGINGAIITKVADLLVTNNKFDRVIIVPLAISGSPISEWGAGGSLYDRMCVAVRRLAARGITPAVTNVTFASVLMQGEADGAGGTSAIAYQTSVNQMIDRAASCGFSGRWFISLETWSLGVVYPTIRGAQAGLANGSTIFVGGDLDTILGTGRTDNIHFNDTGGATAATLTYNAMVASGAPF